MMSSIQLLCGRLPGSCKQSGKQLIASLRREAVVGRRMNRDRLVDELFEFSRRP